MKSLKKKIKKSFRAQTDAKKIIPGLTQLLSKRPDRFSNGVWPCYYSKAKGSCIWDLDGNQYLDMSIGGIGATILGYADKDVDNAVKKIISNGVASSLNCYEEVTLAKKLINLHKWSSKVRFTRSGGEAMTAAVRIARAFNAKEKVLFCGYHGWEDWYISANLGAKDKLAGHLANGLKPNGVPKKLKGMSIPFLYNDEDTFKKLMHKHGERVAAIVMEPVRNIKPSKSFFNTIKEYKKKYNSVLIIDEISSGFRLLTGGAHLKYGIEPDIAVFSKGLGNGYPISAIIGKSSIMNAAESTFLSSTNWTERIGPTAAIAMITKHEKHNVSSHLHNLGKRVQNGWKSLAANHKINISVSGIYPMSSFSFLEKNPLALRAYFVQEMLKKNILAGSQFYAMFSHSFKDVELYLNEVDEIFCRMRSLIDNEKIESELVGEPAVAGFKRYN